MTDQLTAAHALLARFVEQVEILSGLVEQDRPFDLTLDTLEQLATDARAIVNFDPAVARAAAIAESKYGTAAAATVAQLASPPAPAPVEIKAPLPGGDRSATRHWVMDEQYPTGHGADFAYLDTLKLLPEDELGDDGFTVTVADYGTGKAVEAEADMWFHSRGFFKLSTSDALPADVMARALAAAYLVVRDAAYSRFQGVLSSDAS